MLIFKIVHAAEWREAESVGTYAGSPKDRADGFLHFSTAEQAPGTLEKYYSGMTDLILICVDAVGLGSALKFEPARDGALFPHLYGSLALSAVAWSRSLELDPSGAFNLPPELEAARR